MTGPVDTSETKTGRDDQRVSGATVKAADTDGSLTVIVRVVECVLMVPVIVKVTS